MPQRYNTDTNANYVLGMTRAKSGAFAKALCIQQGFKYRESVATPDKSGADAVRMGVESLTSSKGDGGCDGDGMLRDTRREDTRPGYDGLGSLLQGEYGWRQSMATEIGDNEQGERERVCTCSKRRGENSDAQVKGKALRQGRAGFPRYKAGIAKVRAQSWNLPEGHMHVAPSFVIVLALRKVPLVVSEPSGVSARLGGSSGPRLVASAVGIHNKYSTLVEGT
ncbi:hypothetical protein EDB89DRAFT_1913777 [Lactarius sanguifluus]|nr:hypothetical protein EDB89DRAFT_1913777 [Lactarius sanguifluus]